MDNKDEDKKKTFKHDHLRKPHYYGVKDGIHVFHGNHEDHKNHIGKHLNNPTEEDFRDGLKEAASKKLNMLYIHGAPPQSLRSEIHPQLGAHVPSLGKTELEVQHSWTGDEDLMKADDDAGPEVEFDHKKYHGKPVAVHWNVTTNRWSVKCAKEKRIVGHTDSIALHKPTFTVGPAGNERVRQEKSKNVHATVNGDVDASHTDYSPKKKAALTDVTYNPYKYKQFVKRHSDEEEVHEADHVIMDGEPGGMTKAGKPCPRGKVYASNTSSVRSTPNRNFRGEVERAAAAKAERMSASKKVSPSKKIEKSLSKGEKPNKSIRSTLLSQLHEELKSHPKWKESVKEVHENFFNIKPRKIKKPTITTPKKEMAKIEDLSIMAKDVLKKIESVTLSTRDLAKGLISPEKNCGDCGCTVENCMCFDGFSEPSFDFDGKKLTVLFKSDWDDESKESFLDDFKRRAGRLLKK